MADWFYEEARLTDEQRADDELHAAQVRLWQRAFPLAAAAAHRAFLGHCRATFRNNRERAAGEEGEP